LEDRIIKEPEDITEERLDEMEQQLRTALEKKKLIVDRMDLIVAPVVKQFPDWKTRLTWG